ncbi:hypothetical protein F4604DRAFT_1968767 [Suillus subluteus]|nr:hypothetical protein F4604DRAFT_1968767 [Suillus subluteus]
MGHASSPWFPRHRRDTFNTASRMTSKKVSFDSLHIVFVLMISRIHFHLYDWSWPRATRKLKGTGAGDIGTQTEHLSALPPVLSCTSIAVTNAHVACAATLEEIHSTLHEDDEAVSLLSVFAKKRTPVSAEWNEPHAEQDMASLLRMCSIVLSLLEKARRDKYLKISLEAEVDVILPDDISVRPYLLQLIERAETFLKTLFIVHPAGNDVLKAMRPGRLCIRQTSAPTKALKRTDSATEVEAHIFTPQVVHPHDSRHFLPTLTAVQHATSNQLLPLEERTLGGAVRGSLRPVEAVLRCFISNHFIHH